MGTASVLKSLGMKGLLKATGFRCSDFFGGGQYGDIGEIMGIMWLEQ
jgi:hypothetical protein